MAEQEQRPQQSQNDIAPTPIPDALRLQDGSTEIVIWKNNGGINLTVQHKSEALALTIQEQEPHMTFTYGRGSQTEAIPLTPEPSPTPERLTITVSGFIGRDPIFRPDKDKNLVYLFPLGHHPEKGVTHWYDVYATEEQAKRYQAAFEKGHEVEVTGEDHTHITHTKKTGEERIVYEVHASHIARIVTRRHKERE